MSVAKAIHEQIVSNDVEIIAVTDSYINVYEDRSEDGEFNRACYDVVLDVVAEPIVIAPGHPFEL
jgi:hypothetical protein